jgi:alkylation response protein AidB-like acyl-CoA dehydrogenase
LIDADAPGITVTARHGHRQPSNRPTSCFTRSLPKPADLICDPRHAPHLLDRAYDAGRLHLAAEMLGAAQEAFDRAVEYLKTRVQFGKKIGEFQALQHRAAILFGELEIARSVVLKAAATQHPGTCQHGQGPGRRDRQEGRRPRRFSSMAALASPTISISAFT